MWVTTYGTDIESVEHYNIVLNRLVLNQHATIIDAQAGKTFADPNDPNDTSLEARISKRESKPVIVDDVIRTILGNLETRIKKLENKEADLNRDVIVEIDNGSGVKSVTVKQEAETIKNVTGVKIN